MRRPLVLALALLAVPAAAHAQSRWERQVAQQLDLVAKDLAPRGYHVAGEPFTGQLAQGRTARFRVALRPNVTYALVGLCDEDCRDLDLRMLDERDREITTTAVPGDKPFLEVTVEAGGKFTLVVTMAQCGTPPCSYGVGLFSK
jgi:hypothetical protein